MNLLWCTCISFVLPLNIYGQVNSLGSWLRICWWSYMKPSFAIIFPFFHLLIFKLFTVFSGGFPLLACKQTEHWSSLYFLFHHWCKSKKYIYFSAVVCNVLPRIHDGSLVLLLCVFRACEMLEGSWVDGAMSGFGRCNVMFFTCRNQNPQLFVVSDIYKKSSLRVGPWWETLHVAKNKHPEHTIPRLKHGSGSIVLWEHGRDVLKLKVDWANLLTSVVLTFLFHFLLDYIWRPDKVYVAEFHCSHWFFPPVSIYSLHLDRLLKDCLLFTYWFPL